MVLMSQRKFLWHRSYIKRKTRRFREMKKFRYIQYKLWDFVLDFKQIHWTSSSYIYSIRRREYGKILHVKNRQETTTILNNDKCNLDNIHKDEINNYTPDKSERFNSILTVVVYSYIFVYRESSDAFVLSSCLFPRNRNWKLSRVVVVVLSYHSFWWWTGKRALISHKFLFCLIKNCSDYTKWVMSNDWFDLCTRKIKQIIIKFISTREREEKRRTINFPVK